MDPITRQAIAVAAGGAAAGDAIYVDDVFSTFLYEGDGGTQAIDNGIDFSGEGGLVWIKRRDSSNGHFLVDTERGRASNLNSSSSSAAGTSSANRDLVSFNNNGFTVGPAQYENLNGSGRDFVSWSFRKAPGFFDVVTYTGNGAAGRTVSHNLGSVPGFIIVKRYSATEDWTCYHRSAGATKYLQLNSLYAEVDDNRAWNDTEPTSSVFTVGTHDRVNTNGQNYVAYVFAHDDQSFGTDSDESIIKCGSYTGNGSSSGPVIDLGFEPQWLLIKRTSNTDDWILFDNMRGMATGVQDARLEPNTTDAEDAFGGVDVLPTGFQLASGTGFQNSNGDTYIYMAIRRPHKPPTAGTEVFELKSRTSTNPNLFTTSLSYVDVAWNKVTSANGSWLVTGRLLGNFWLAFNATHAKQTPNPAIEYDYNNKIMPYWWSAGQSEINYLFKRAPGFFDVVTYTGNGSNRTISHNLGSVPGMILIKMTSDSDSWVGYHTSTGATHYLTPNMNIAAVDNDSRFNDTEPTASVFTVGTDNGVNQNGRTFIAYLFATLDGISKVGSYSGTGYGINVNCGFTAGARFVLIKRTDSSGDWYVWDTTRGIVSGNDPYSLLNSQASQVANTDYIDPLNAGFTVTSSAPAALNASGGTYLFLAIA